jgi:hypothetical protein
MRSAVCIALTQRSATPPSYIIKTPSRCYCKAMSATETARGTRNQRRCPLSSIRHLPKSCDETRRTQFYKSFNHGIKPI